MNGLSSTFGSALLDWGPLMLGGAVVTLQISAGAFSVGLCIGIVVAMIKIVGLRPLVLLANGYTSVCRAVPELLLILLLYYAGGDLVNGVLAQFGREPVAINGFIAAVVVLGVVQGAYAAEIIRGAIGSIAYGHIEAARAFGCPRSLVLQRIILPEMLPFALGGLANLWLILIKESALISVVGYRELLFVTKQAAGSTQHYMRFYLAVAGVYLAITLLSNLVFGRIENRIARWLPANAH